MALLRKPLRLPIAAGKLPALALEGREDEDEEEEEDEVEGAPEAEEAAADALDSMAEVDGALDDIVEFRVACRETNGEIRVLRG